MPRRIRLNRSGSFSSVLNVGKGVGPKNLGEKMGGPTERGKTTGVLKTIAQSEVSIRGGEKSGLY